MESELGLGGSCRGVYCGHKKGIVSIVEIPESETEFIKVPYVRRYSFRGPVSKYATEQDSKISTKCGLDLVRRTHKGPVITISNHGSCVLKNVGMAEAVRLN